MGIISESLLNKWDEMGVYDESEEPEVKKQYDVIMDKPKIKFVKKISEKLEEGWNLQGGIAYADGYFMQAIYREITYSEYYEE